MMRKFFKALVTVQLIALATVASTVHASYPKSSTQAYEGGYAHIDYVSTNKITPTATANGRTVTVSAFISTKNSKVSSSGTIYVEKKTKNGWKSKGNWPFSGNGKYSISQDYSGKRGTYRAHVIATIGGDSVDIYSSELTIN